MLTRLEDACSPDPPRQAFHGGNYALQSFVNLPLLTDCPRLGDEAERACAGHEKLLIRGRRARLSLDLLALFNRQRLQSGYRRRHYSSAGFPFHREAIERRYTEARLASVAQFFCAV